MDGILARASVSVARLAAVVALGAVSLLASAPTAGAVTLGHTAAPTGTCASNFERFVLSANVGNSYIVPSVSGVTAWTLTSWSHPAIAGAEQTLTMKFYRPLGGVRYQVVGQDTRPLASGALNTFQKALDVRTGDVLGLYANVNNSGCLVPGNTSEFFFFNAGPGLSDGQSADFIQVMASQVPNISAEITPTNSFTLALSRNKKKGTATESVTVPNPGTLTVSGKGVKAVGARARTAVTVPSAGVVNLPIRAKGKKAKKLNSTGKVKLTPTITYTPTGGIASSQTPKVKLKKR